MSGVEETKKGAVPMGGLITYLKHPHWHLIFVHFPISAFLGSFGFMVLHLFLYHDVFELAGYVCLIAGAAVMIPTTLSGWYAWKGRFKGYRTEIFVKKIRTSFVMIALSTGVVLYRTFFVADIIDIYHEIWHTLFFVCSILLMVGATIEGYYGGRLNHR